MKALLTGLFCLSCVATLRAGFIGSDDFNAASLNPANWSSATLSGSAVLTQNGDGVLRYSATSNGTVSDAAALIWQPGTAPFSSDWSMQMDVANPRAIGAGQYFNIGISTRKTANLNQGYSVRLDATDGTPQSIGWETDKENGVTTTMDRYNTAVHAGSVLLTWKASTHILTAAFDENGATGGYVWTSFSTYDPTQAGTWNMSAADSFTFVVTGSSNNATIAPADGITADNFLITGTAATISTTVPEPSAALLVMCGGMIFAAGNGPRRRSAKGRR